MWFICWSSLTPFFFFPPSLQMRNNQGSSRNLQMYFEPEIILHNKEMIEDSSKQIGYSKLRVKTILKVSSWKFRKTSSKEK